MYHDAAVGESGTFSLSTCHQQDCSHGGCHACTDGGYIAGDELHGVVDTKSSRDTTARAVDVYGYVLAVVDGVQIEQLSLKGVSGVVIDFCSQENDAVHHESGEHIHLCNVELALLQNIWVEVLVLATYYII